MYNGYGDVTALLGTDGTLAASYYYDTFGNASETHYYNASGTETSKAEIPWRYKVINKLRSELNKFWNWASMTKEEYAGLPDYGDWESGYPSWEELLAVTEDALNTLPGIKEKSQYEEMLTLILDVAAIDNYTGKVIKRCREILTNCPEFCDTAVVHLLPGARMQVADLIGEIGDLTLIQYLKILANDKINYVQRSALVALSKIVPEVAEEIAYNKIEDKDEYIRLFSLILLKRISSTKLPTVMEILKNDESQFIQEELKAIF
ncbi:hypothetical protein CLHUN_16170 [Ruminiclostridium hungatei]|uniref:HEAT repeat protein n=1 Tax=Ruminiclostridium hungatei TaxID=48256 RepID=A0A1V4SLF3_RUMHU|nr:hypothetical protein [Ruminiclostridium hungatei]OPX44623.1 hypothetical protein CLHUN_16170 [Ruminiclostridium hungatei]